MQEYVLILGQPIQSQAALGDLNIQVLIVEKAKPEWQKGRYNLPGGHVEAGEDPDVAALREFKEETGNIMCHGALPEKCGIIKGDWGIIHCYKIWCDPKKKLAPRPEEVEKVFWIAWQKVRNDERLQPNLRVAMPLLLLGVKDWVIYDQGPTFTEETHTFGVEVKSTTKNYG